MNSYMNKVARWTTTPVPMMTEYEIHLLSNEKLHQYKALMNVWPRNKGTSPSTISSWYSYQYSGSFNTLRAGMRHSALVIAQITMGPLRIVKWYKGEILYSSTTPTQSIYIINPPNISHFKHLTIICWLNWWSNSCCCWNFNTFNRSNINMV